MTKPLIIANWKTNPSTLREAAMLAESVESATSHCPNAEVVVAPPFPFLLPVKSILKKAKLGAQNAFWSSGPYTGEVSWPQLKEIGVEYIIIGHSERKNLLGETTELINKKVKTLLKNKIKTILCVGEKERPGRDIPEEVGAELKAYLEGVKPAELGHLLVAYEPVWAISTNPHSQADTPANAFQAFLYLRRVLVKNYGSAASKKVKIIYGGSVNSQNVTDFLTEGKMQGALVGGASLKAEEFAEIIKKVSRKPS